MANGEYKLTGYNLLVDIMTNAPYWLLFPYNEGFEGEWSTYSPRDKLISPSRAAIPASFHDTCCFARRAFSISGCFTGIATLLWKLAMVLCQRQRWHRRVLPGHPYLFDFYFWSSSEFPV